MSPSELIFRIILAVLFPPLGIIGMRNMGCGTLLLLLILTLLVYVPGLVAAIFLIMQEYNRQNN